ncbi:Retinoblastoma-related protein [Melia azedarach]|uniref:Retinoblastoma-related protein n=1 Tax=Melia azedarach TaxID=155640 RepID=A0ACC1Z1I1_MELAZ|nr:Retinoblastoma-related protein [Melia azedarach]
MVNLKFDGGAVKRKSGEVGSAVVATNLVSPPRSPASHANGSTAKITSTPVKTARNTATNWLETDISPLPSKPPPELEKFLAFDSRNIVNEVVNRANILLGAIFPCIEQGQRLITRSLLNVNLMDSLWSGQEQVDALKLYYKVLESICKSEAEKFRSRDLSCFLTNEKFHRCLLACSAELVSMARTRISILLSLILERVGITAFDVSKVIESFIKHEDRLPGELRRHLNSLEETLLESMVWEKGSSLYNSLMVTRPDLSEEINQLKLLSKPTPSLDHIAMNNNVGPGGLARQQNLHKQKLSVGQDGAKRQCDEYSTKLVKHNSSASAMKDDPPTSNGLPVKLIPLSPSLQTAFLSPTTQSKTPKEGSAHKDAAITVLFNKVTKLAAIRISSMAERLKLSQQIREKIYLLFQQILTEKTCLFFDRHIDLIMLCCFYGVTKISSLDLTFKELTHSYVKEPQCRSQDFSCVLATWLSQLNGRHGENCLSVTAFYNKIFIPNVGSLVKEIGSAGAPKQVPEVNNNAVDNCPNTPQRSPFPRIPVISPKKVSPSQNVYFSPLRSSKKDALNSHVGKSYYAFIGERTSAYQSPSKDLDAINKCLNTNKRRRMLNFDDANLTFISDSVVATSLFFENDKM